MLLYEPNARIGRYKKSVTFFLSVCSLHIQTESRLIYYAGNTHLDSTVIWMVQYCPINQQWELLILQTFIFLVSTPYLTIIFNEQF